MCSVSSRTTTDGTSSSSNGTDISGRISGIGTFSGRAPLAPGGLPGFTGPIPSTSLDKGLFGWQVQTRNAIRIWSAALARHHEMRDAEASQRRVFSHVHD